MKKEKEEENERVRWKEISAAIKFSVRGIMDMGEAEALEK